MTAERCTAGCADAVPCPSCGSPLPPRGRSVPLEMNLATCCDEARMDPRINTRHLWNAAEANDWPFNEGDQR